MSEPLRRVDYFVIMVLIQTQCWCFTVLITGDKYHSAVLGDIRG